MKAQEIKERDRKNEKSVVDQSFESTNNVCMMISIVVWVVGMKAALSSCLSLVVYWNELCCHPRNFSRKSTSFSAFESAFL